MPPSPILLLGASGQLGHELRHTLAPLGPLVCPTRDELDLTARSSVRSTIRTLRPSLIVNAAAYTAVDRAETERDRAWLLNAEVPATLAEEAHRCGARLIHYSTDYVFDGTNDIPYTEQEAPAPLNVYGASKWAGEQGIQAHTDNYWIFRTSWLYSDRRSNFLLTMLRLAATRDRLTVVDDQFGSPTWVGWVAEATASMLPPSGPPGHGLPAGTYHLSSGGTTSWCDFARAIFHTFDVSGVDVVPIPTTEYPTPAARPRYSVLSPNAVQREGHLSIPTWTEQLEAMAVRCSPLASLAQSGPPPHAAS